MMTIWHIAGKELSDGLRNRWMLAIALIFAILAVAVTWFGAAASGKVGFSSIPATVASLSSLASFLIPLIALMLAYDAIVGEDENGTLILLLSYPVTRGQLLVGKFLGHSIILAMAIVVGFGAAALSIVFLAKGVDQRFLIYALARFMLSSALLGWVFLAMAYGISSWVIEKSRAAGLALVLWFFFVLVADLLLLGILVASKGQLNPQLLPWLLLANPTDIYRLMNLSSFDHDGVVTGVLALGQDLPMRGVALWGCLLAWVILPLGWAYWLLRRRAL